MDDMIVLIKEDVLIGLNTEAALESANEIVISKLKHDSFYGADCYKSIKDSMALNLSLTLARLFDPGAKRYPPNKSDVASIPLLVRLLKQKRCRAVLVARAREGTPQLPEFADARGATCERSIDLAIDAYAKLRTTHAGRKAAETLKQFRDKKLCHSLMTSILKALPQYKQLFLLMDVARDVVEHGNLAIKYENLDLQDFEDEQRSESRAFWEPALKGAVAAAEP